MEARAKILGHPIHQMLIVFPLGLLGSAVIFDIIGLIRHQRGWSASSYHMIAAGVVFGLIAAVFGFIDYLAIPSDTRAKRIGRLHGIGNVVVVVLFAASWNARRWTPDMPGKTALALAVAGLLLALLTGWLGGELVDRLGVGVDDGAHLNASSSLSGRPASSDARPAAR
jgi:uncharacterized membrane protein